MNKEMKIIFKSTREKISMIFISIEFIFQKYENVNEIILFIKKWFLFLVYRQYINLHIWNLFWSLDQVERSLSILLEIWKS